jgi:hypothetical protein
MAMVLGLAVTGVITAQTAILALGAVGGSLVWPDLKAGPRAYIIVRFTNS